MKNPPDKSDQEVNLNQVQKRQKLECESPFLSPNSFSALQDIEDMNTEVSNSNSQSISGKKDIPPPIFITNIVNMNALLAAINKLNPGNYKHITINNEKVKFNFETVEGYRLAIKYLQENNAQFHTYQMKTE